MPATLVTTLSPLPLVLSYLANLVKPVDLITLNTPDMISGQEEHDTRQNVTWSPRPGRVRACPMTLWTRQSPAVPRRLTPPLDPSFHLQPPLDVI